MRAQGILPPERPGAGRTGKHLAALVHRALVALSVLDRRELRAAVPARGGVEARSRIWKHGAAVRDDDDGDDDDGDDDDDDDNDLG